MSTSTKERASTKETAAKPEKTARKDLPQILDQEIEDKDDIVFKLERGLDLKKQIGTEPDEKKGVEGSGLLKEYYDIRKDLAADLVLSGLEGFRHNNVVFVSTHMPGRETLDAKRLVEELVARNIDPKVVAECMRLATVEGKGYYKNEIVDLNKSRKARADGKGENGKESAAWDL